jgi:aminopeptidase
MDPRVDKMADVLVNYSTEVRPGQLVQIRVLDPIAQPLALAIYRHVLEAGGNAVITMAPSGADYIFLKHASNEQINWLSPTNMWLIENIDVLISISAPVNTKALSNIDSQRVSQLRRTNQPWLNTYMQRASAGSLHWVTTQYPTQAAAQDAEMSLTEYEDFVYGACMVTEADPVGHWKSIHDEQQRLVDWLKGKERVEVSGENIDLSLSIKDRTFINASGLRNFPDGEIFTGPVEDSVNGWVKFTYPAIYQGREVEGVELRFENGKIVNATATKGEDYLNSILNTDEGARYLGEFAIGTNRGIQKFTRNILFDEKIAGTVHMAVGKGYPDTGSKNDSAHHWDMICDMRSGGEIRVDGALFYQNGEFNV